MVDRFASDGARMIAAVVFFAALYGAYITLLRFAPRPVGIVFAIASMLAAALLVARVLAALAATAATLPAFGLDWFPQALVWLAAEWAPALAVVGLVAGSAALVGSPSRPLAAAVRQIIGSLLPPLILIFLVLGTIFQGIATPTEGGAMGAVGALVLALLNRRLNFRHAVTGP